MAEYYDYILGLIPLLTVGGASLLMLAGASHVFAIFVGAALTLPVVGHALFVQSPGSRPAQPRSAGTDVSAVDSDVTLDAAD